MHVVDVIVHLVTLQSYFVCRLSHDKTHPLPRIGWQTTEPDTIVQLSEEEGIPETVVS